MTVAGQGGALPSEGGTSGQCAPSPSDQVLGRPPGGQLVAPSASPSGCLGLATVREISPANSVECLLI